MNMCNQKNITFSGIINDVRKQWPESTDEQAMMIADTILLFYESRRRQTYRNPVKGKKLLDMINTNKS